MESNSTTIYDRLISICDHYSISLNEFENRCGIPNGFVRKEKRNIYPANRRKIMEAFPSVNMGWLMNGEGDMLKDADKVASVANNATVSDLSGVLNQSYNDSAISDAIKLLREQLSKKDEQIDRLLTIIQQM